MMFKNMIAYRLTGPAPSAAQLSEALANRAFQPCGQMEHESTGWTAPVDGGELVHTVQGQILIQLTTETKILPGSVINQIAKERAVELEQDQGFKPCRKQMKALKETIEDELLPRALARRINVRAWIDPKNGWFVVDTGTAARADHLFRALLKSLDVLPFASLRTQRSPMTAMTSWLDLDEAPAGFTVDRDAVLRASGEGKGTVKFSNVTLEVDDICHHIASGKQCTQLALTWADRVSFVLTENLIIKRVQPLDVIRENGNCAEGPEERFDADFLLMAGEYAQMLGELVEALGGEEVAAMKVAA